MEPALIQAHGLAEIWARLDRVMDPELDEPVTDMGFIEAVSITAHGQVAVDFRLPTYWCSPNFAFLMAEDIKREVETLDWVDRATVTLHDHMAADEMNVAINAGASFGSVFEDLHPGENLAELREKFDQKAFQRRQEVVIKALLAQGFTVDAIVSMTLATLESTVLADPDASLQQTRYLALLAAKTLAKVPGDLALPTYQGMALTRDGFATYMGLLRSVRINMEFSGSLCRGLKQSRYQQADLSGETPVLVNFVTADQPTHVCR